MKLCPNEWFKRNRSGAQELRILSATHQAAIRDGETETLFMRFESASETTVLLEILAPHSAS
jgi:hypothetical protein